MLTVLHVYLNFVQNFGNALAFLHCEWIWPRPGWSAATETGLGHFLPPKGLPIAHICKKVLNTTFPLNMLPHHPLSAMRLNSVRLQRTLHD